MSMHIYINPHPRFSFHTQVIQSKLDTISALNDQIEVEYAAQHKMSGWRQVLS